MKTAAQSFGEVVEKRLKALKTNAFSVEKARGLPVDAIRNVMRSEKRAGPTLVRAEEICQALDLELYIGLPREPEPLTRTVTKDSLTTAHDDFVLVQTFEVNLSAGPGLIPAETNGLDQLAFSRAWMSRNGINSQLCGLVRVRGDSMLPTIPDGAMVLVHLPETQVVDEGIYAFSRNGEAFVKRMIPVNKGKDGRVTSLVIFSDNPAYPPDVLVGEALNEIRIVGRIRCAMTTF